MQEKFKEVKDIREKRLYTFISKSNTSEYENNVYINIRLILRKMK